MSCQEKTALKPRVACVQRADGVSATDRSDPLRRERDFSDEDRVCDVDTRDADSVIVRATLKLDVLLFERGYQSPNRASCGHCFTRYSEGA